MDIAVIGPEKFAFQDMACIELALSFRSFGSFTMVPEPIGGEDAIIKWGGGSSSVLEIQVKGAKGKAGIASLADYLIHYPPRSGGSSLLQRLMDESERYVLFILSARCSDELAPLLRPPSLPEKPFARAVPSVLAKALQSEIARRSAVKPKKVNKLAQSRLADLGTLARRSIKDFELVLAKTIIVEQESAEAIEVRLHARLRAERFDTLSIRGILALFSDILANAKRMQSDAFAPILKELLAHAPSAIRPNNYLDRGIEGDLEVKLCVDRLLLLAGPPRAGKSWLARAIAGRMQNEGYEVRRGSVVEEAERFLTDPVGAERIYVLDDPIGPREPHYDANARLVALGALCERIPANRRLVVAQSEQVLLQAKAAPDLAACRLGGKDWLRLEPLSIEVAIDIWRSVAPTQSISESDIFRVVGLIKNEPGMRDPGALTYLAQTWDLLPKAPLDEEILLQARKDASDFARNLAMQTPDLRDLLTASALATTASTSAAVSEIAFIVNDNEDRPSFAPEFEIISVLGDEMPRSPPAYASKQLLNKGQQHGLEILQRRRVLINQDDKFNFGHPYLRAGAQTLLSPDIAPDLQRSLAQLERAIASPSPITSLAAARNLRWVRSLLLQFSHDEIFEIAYLGTRSLFPATRDYCFEFLVDSADLLPQRIREHLPNLSENMAIGLDRIDVTHGVGLISNRYDWFSTASTLKEIRPYLNAIEEGNLLGLDLSLSRRILQALERYPKALTATAMKRFLRADEAVVRASAARLWTAVPRDDDDEILVRISDDPTPAMSKMLLKGLSFCWEKLSKHRREKILKIIAKQASSPSCASVLLSRLVLFNREEHFGKLPPWKIFTTLMPIVVDNLPISVSFANGRFCAVIDDAILQVPADELVSTLNMWAKRLLQRVDRCILSEFELDIVQPLLSVAGSETRLPILQNLLDVKDTGVRVVITKRLVESWDTLESAERKLLQAALTDGRKDTDWLAATVLTRRNPPSDLVAILTGAPNTLERSTAEIEQNFHMPLFRACVHMFVGWPQPLWWFATHHSRSSVWIRVIRDLAKNYAHPLHAVAFYEIANFGDEGELAALIDELPDVAINDTFERMLDFKISHVGDWRREAWNRLFDRADQAQLDGFLTRIDSVLDGILEHPRDLKYWLGEGFFVTRVLNLVLNDLKGIKRTKDIYNMYVIAQKKFQDEGVNNEKSVVESLFPELCSEELMKLHAEPPRIYGSWQDIGNLFKKMGASSEILSEIEKKRIEALDRHQAIGNRFIGSPTPVELNGWINQANVN